MGIKLLDDRLVNKIAAGEVVERPASVVKELVENAIDAGSSRISITTAGGGIDRIEVADNGAGIAAGDIALAFQRHATSKIADESDLLQIHTMGFRGEALPSIDSVSKIELYSQCEGCAGIRMLSEGGKIKHLEPFPTAPGTKIIVTDIFFNTPVRKKFLKSTVSEGIHIQEMVIKLALSRPDISFAYANEKKLYFKTPGNGMLEDAIVSIYGKDFSGNFMGIQWQGESYALQGLISKPEYRRVNRKNQLFYVNNRFIKSPMLARAVDEGYRGHLLSREYPAVILFITVESEMVDVNVHPQKTEIRFRDEKVIFHIVSRAIRETLAKSSYSINSAISELESTTPSLTSWGAKLLVNDSNLNSIRKDAPVVPAGCNLNSIRKDAPVVPIGSEHRWYPKIDSRNKAYDNYRAPLVNMVSDQKLPFQASELSGRVEIAREIPTNIMSDTSEYAVIGQCFNSYILVEKDETLWLVDQHAAHERINYNRFLENSSEAYDSQLLTFPLAVDLSSAQMDLLESKLSLLKEIGFDIEELGSNTAIIRSAPTLLQGRELEFIGDILELYEHEKPADLKNEIFALMACKQSIKAGQSLSRPEMAMIINDLLQVDNYQHCPHGRPTIIQLSHQELDKRFKRK